MQSSVCRRLVIGVLSACAVGGAAASGATWYVDDSAPGGGSGTSWTTPFNTLQAALTAAAASGDEIHVGGGTYAPAGPGGARSATFTINKSLTIKGGYCGFGAGSNADFLCGTASILTGDLNGDDGTNFENNGENSVRVVTLSGAVTVRMENFTISGGNANSGNVTGGGLFVSSGATFTGVYLKIQNNHAISWGGGVDHNGLATSVYKFCDFRRNRAGQFGGAVSLSSGNGARMGMCRFAGNTLTATSATSGGGAVWINGPSSIINCLFTGNAATRTSGYGGGAIGVGASAGASQIVNCSFAFNSTPGPFAEYAYAIASYANAPGPTVTNCLFSDDDAFYSQYEIVGNVQASYCLNSGETGTGNINTNISFVDKNGFDNQDGTLDDDLTVAATYGYGPGVDVGNRAALPADIMDLDNDGNTAEAWPDSAVFYETSAGYSRFAQHGPTPDGPAAGSPPIDIGAFEYRGTGDVPGPVIYVDSDSHGDLSGGQGCGSTWGLAVSRLSTAIILANTFPSLVTEIRLGAGVYRQDVDSYISRPNLLIRGGFAGFGSNTPDTRDPDALATVFDGDMNSNDPAYLADPSLTAYSDNLRFSLAMSSTANPITIDGLRLRNQFVNGVMFDTSECNITLRDIQVSRSYVAAGVLLMYPTLSNVATMTDCTFDNLRYDFAGVAWQRFGSTLRMVNCRLTDLKSDPVYTSFIEGPGRQGGAVWHENSATTSMVNCLFNGNEAAHGAVFYTDNAASQVSISNCTLVNNRARYSGGSVFFNGGLPQISNSILWGNTAPANPQMYYSGTPGSSTFQYSIIQGGVTQGTSVVNSDPQFVDANGADNVAGNADDDFRLRLTSPGVDLGSVSALALDTNDLDRDLNTTEVVPFDLDFLARNVDMDFDGTPEPDAGCYEAVAAGVLNITANTSHATIAEAVIAANNGQTVLAPSAQFTSEPFIDFAGKAITIGGFSGITQPSGGRYTLTDGAALGRSTGSLGPSITLNGELRVPAHASAFVNAGNLTNNSAMNVFDGASLAAGVAGTVSGAGNLRLYSGATFSTAGGLTSTGVVNALPGSTLSTVGALSLGGTSTLQGATVVSGGTASVSAVTNWTGSSITAPTLSIANTGRFTGSGSVYANTTNAGRVYTVGNSLFVGNLTNNAGGIITVQLGTATLIGSLTNNGTINGVLSNPPLPPPGSGDETVAFYREFYGESEMSRTMAGDGMFVRGDYVAGATASLSLPDAVWRLTVAGNYDCATNSNTLYDMRLAELVMARPEATANSSLEAMSLDRGNVAAGLDRTLAGSFPIGTLRVGAGAAVSTVDARDNVGDGQAACEAVYCDKLIIESGAVLGAPSCRVYYRTLTNLGGTIANPANIVRIPPPCGGADFNNDGVVNTADLVFFLGRFGQPVTPGSLAERADFNADGAVNTTDLVFFLGRFGSVCPI